MIRFGSVCSGIEAASVAWHPLGWEAAWLAEIEPFPCAVLAHHYPAVPNLGDMSRLADRIRALQVEAPDVFCGGTPCQAFSVAGLRRSLDDDRGNLSLTFCEIADAIDSTRSIFGKQPAVIFWENVPGVLSTKDNAFGCFLAGLAGEDEPLQPAGGRWTDAGCVLGPTRAVAWRILDAQYFGLAQRRRRVFVVASARAGFNPAAVLFEWEGVRRDSAPSREAGKVSPTIPARSTGGGGLGTDFDLDGGVIQHAQCKHCAEFFSRFSCSANTHGECDCPKCQGYCECQPPNRDAVFCIKGAAIGRKPEAGPQHGEVLEDVCYTQNCVDQHAVAYPAQPYSVANCLTARMYKGINTALDEGQTPVVTHSLRGEGFDASEDGTGRGTPLVPVHAFDARQSKVIQYGDKTGPLDTHGHSIGVVHPIAMVNMQGSKGNAVAQADGPSFTLNAMHGHDMHAIVQAVAIRTANTSANGHGISDELAHTLDGAQGQSVAFVQNSRDEVRLMNGDGGIVGALAAQPGMKQSCYVAQPIIFGTQMSHPQVDFNLNQTLQAKNPMAVAKAMQVRRLTPMECERLQGFPDGYTAIPWRGKPADQCPDGPRYKALGNSWAVPVVRWIGQRINTQLENQ